MDWCLLQVNRCKCNAAMHANFTKLMVDRLEEDCSLKNLNYIWTYKRATREL